MNRYLLLLSFFLFVSACTFTYSSTPTAIPPSETHVPTSTQTPSPTITPTATNTPTQTSTATSTPTQTSSATITHTPTITPTPTPLGGAQGKVIGSCSDETYSATSIYILDLETGEYHRPNDFPQTIELWIMDSIIDISPDGDRIIWWRTEIKDFTIEDNRFVNFNEFNSESIISNINFSDQQAYIGESSPYVWLSNDIFIELKLHIVGTDLESVDMFLVDLKNQTRNKFIEPHPYSGLGSGKISPDGKFVAFTGGLAALDWEQELGAIYILDLDTLEENLELVQIPSHTILILQGGWSPDSSKFLYWGSYLDEATGNIYWGTHIIDLKTLKPRFVGMFYSMWSADPEILLGFHQGKFVHLDLYGSVIKEILLPPSLNFDSLFRQPLPPFPDGSGFFIYTNIEDTKTYNLYAYDLSTDDLSEVIEFKSEPYFDVESSTDGKWLLLRTKYSEELGDAPMPSDRLASDYEWEETWYICNQVECITFSPPGTDECNQVYWLGPYKFSDN